MTAAGLGTAEIRGLRGPKHPIDPLRPIGQRWEVERALRQLAEYPGPSASHARASSPVTRRHALTVFLAGAECPFTCVFCDLWKHTLPGATPGGALPTQLAAAISAAREERTPKPDDAIKLYNASNFFDRRAVPAGDLAAIADLCAPFSRVTVECHPRLIGEEAEAFAESLDGRLEVAMGLETIHPIVFPKLNKGMTLEDVRSAVAWARDRSIGVRAFVLVGLPWVAPSEYATWAVRSVEYAASLGVDRVSLIPLRMGNGALDQLARSGDLGPVRLGQLETALDDSLERARGTVIVEADTWDLELFSDCDICFERRAERVSTINLVQASAAPVACTCHPS